MAGKQWAKARDANELEIVKALRKRGVAVYRIESTLDPGVFDLLCEVDGERLHGVSLGQPFDIWILLEVKNLKTNPKDHHLHATQLTEGGEYEGVLTHCSYKAARRMSAKQADFLLRHRAPRYVVTSIEEALRACGLESEIDETE